MSSNSVCNHTRDKHKSESRCTVVRFCYHSYHYRPNWTPLSPITITSHATYEQNGQVNQGVNIEKFYSQADSNKTIIAHARIHDFESATTSVDHLALLLLREAARYPEPTDKKLVKIKHISSISVKSINCIQREENVNAMLNICHDITHLTYLCVM